MENKSVWEMSVILIKPDHFTLREEILERLTTIGEITKYCEAKPTKEDWEAHYYPLRDEKYFIPMINAFTGRDISAMLLSGDNIIQTSRQLIGLHYDPRKLEIGTIRRDFCNLVEFEKILKEKGYCSNVIHGSSSLSEAKREYIVWEKYFK